VVTEVTERYLGIAVVTDGNDKFLIFILFYSVFYQVIHVFNSKTKRRARHRTLLQSEQDVS
jgi:hypothetical protein